MTASALVFFAQTGVYAQGARYDGWHPMMGGWGMGGFGIILNIAIWVLVISAVVWLVRRLLQSEGGRRSDSASGSRALDILKERYARGEIDKSQYEAMKRDILAH